MKINKLDQTFKINPLYEADGYKLGHKAMLAEGTVVLAGTWIPRTLKYMPKGINKIMSAGQQLVVRYLHSSFQENFFSQPIEVAETFIKDVNNYLGIEYDGSHFVELHKLGYLPIQVKALPEGMLTNPNIPHMTFINTVDGYAWLTLYLETYISKLAWQMPVVATIAHKFKENAVKAALETDKNNLFITNFLNHDFHSRGGNPFTSIAVGLGHAISNLGSDTLNVIPAARYYYDWENDSTPIFSVNASEHSVSTTKIFTVGEKQMLSDWMKQFPNGILSVVSDTFDLWKLITEYLPALKEEILARDGKLVIRPDSGNPVDIICGEIDTDGSGYEVIPTGENGVARSKGVIELLWDIFGGTINEQGYKVLDPHIGAIYGDSISLERQEAIYSRLKAKGFATTNIVLGVGSYTYVMVTRDTAGFAAKGCWFEVEKDGVKTPYNIYKDPVTDDGMKVSLRGLVKVDYDSNNEIAVQTECTKEEESQGLLQVIYKNGEFFNQTTLQEIRDRLQND